MNNTVGNIILSQKDEDKHTATVCKIAIEKAEAALDALPKTAKKDKKSQAKVDAQRAELEAIVNGNHEKLASIEERNSDKKKKAPESEPTITK